MTSQSSPSASPHIEKMFTPGMLAAKAYKQILLAHPAIMGCSLFRYSSPPLLQERVAIGPDEQSIIDAALELRKVANIPFWHALFAACLKEGRCPESLLNGALFHNGQGSEILCTREQIQDGRLEQLAADPGGNIALGSRLHCSDGSELHLGMLDFHCDETATNAEIATRLCSKLMPTGYVLINSGDSYHAVTTSPISSSERIAMLGKALLASPIVDALYIGHQLMQSSSSIRISLGGKAKKMPVVIAAAVLGTGVGYEGVGYKDTR